MKLRERLDLYNNNYKMLFYETNFCGRKVYIGNKHNKKCRFCGKTEPEVTFKTIAHAIPEFLGNKKYISNEECDTCNKFFSEQLENHLDKFTKPYRTLAMIKGKSKVPKYRSKSKKTRLFSLLSKELHMEDVVDSDAFDLKLHENKLTLKFELEPYIPTAVYKCLVKIALSFLPHDELSFFKNALKWITLENHSKKLIKPQLIFIKFVPGVNPTKNLSMFLLKKKENVEKYPYCYLILCFGNFIYQLVVPSDEDFKKNKKVSCLFYSFPSPWEINGISLQEWKRNFSGHEVVTDSTESINFSFKKTEEFETEEEMESL